MFQERGNLKDISCFLQGDILLFNDNFILQFFNCTVEECNRSLITEVSLIMGEDYFAPPLHLQHELMVVCEAGSLSLPGPLYLCQLLLVTALLPAPG
jgi:hypothetical protein